MTCTWRLNCDECYGDDTACRLYMLGGHCCRGWETTHCPEQPETCDGYEETR